MRQIAGLGLVAILALSTGCGGGQPPPASTPGPADSAAPQISFELLPESKLTSGTVECAGRVEGGDLVVTLRATEAAGLTALLGQVRYDPEVWQPGRLEPSFAWGDDALSLAAEREPGVLDVGVVMARLPVQSGICGSPELCRLEMLPRGAGSGAAATRSRAGYASEFDFYEYYFSEQPAYATGTLDRRTGDVFWHPLIDGDYDQNGEVNIADLIPLSVHLGKVSDGYAWPAGSIESLVDGDRNREINIADVTVISRHYGTIVDAWQLTYTDDRVEFSALGVAPYSEPIGNRATERIQFYLHLGDIGPSPYIFVQALYNGQKVGMGGMLRESGLHPPRFYTPGYGLGWDSANSSLVWYFRLFGDGDRNGEVNAGDVQVIARFFGEQGPFEPGSEVWYADYDCNGIVAEADLAVVVLNLLSLEGDIGGYLFYSTRDPGLLPRKYSYPALAPVGLRSFDGNHNEWGGLSFASGDYVWLRPFVGDPQDPLNAGAPSEVIQIP